MSEDHQISFNLELNVEQALSEVRRLETLLFRSLGLLRRLGLPEDMRKGISDLQRMIMTIRMLHTAIIALQGATGPIGWALALVGLGTGIASASDMMLSIGE